MSLDRSLLVPVLLAGIAILVAGSSWLMMREASSRDLERRLRNIVPSGAESGATDPIRSGAGLTGLLHSLGEAIRKRSRMYSEEDVALLEGMILAGGFNPRQLLPLVIGAKMVTMVVAPLIAVTFGLLMDLPLKNRALAVALSLPVGIMGPEWILRLIRRPYVKALQRGIPDALDLLVVCAEAGMALESALEQVSKETRSSNPAISSSLAMLLDELRVLPDRREAFANFGRRSGVESLRRLSTILGQTLQYGTPLGQALRSVAQDLRRERLVRMEERAIKLPVKLIFPLILFILPSLFIVLVGGSFIRLIDTLSGGAQ